MDDYQFGAIGNKEVAGMGHETTGTAHTAKGRSDFATHGTKANAKQ